MKNSKKTAFYILEILKKKSGCERRLTQSDILRYLENDYDVEIDRNTLKSLLDILSESLDNIRFEEKKRRSAKGTETLKTGWYIEKEISEDDSYLIYESLLMNGRISAEKRSEIKERLSLFACEPLLHKTSVGACYVTNSLNNERETLLSLQSAIKEKRMVLFSLTVYAHGGKLRLERDENGRVKEYLVYPISLVCSDGRYMLLGGIGDTGTLRYFPVELMYGLTVTDIYGTELPSYTVGSKRLYPENKAEARIPHIGVRARIKVLAEESIVREIYSAFGEGCIITSTRSGKAEIAFECELNAAKAFIMQFGDRIEVLSPPGLRRRISSECKALAERYRYAVSDSDQTEIKKASSRKLLSRN